MTKESLFEFIDRALFMCLLIGILYAFKYQDTLNQLIIGLKGN